MSTILRFKRGTTADLASQVATLGEIMIDTSKKTVVVMDGTTAGGTPLATTSVATSGSAGLMSAADKQKLDGLGGSGTYTLPTASTTVLGGVKVDGTTITISNGVISASSSGGLTSTEVNTAISSALSSYSTTAQVNTLISSATSGLASTSYVDTAVAGVSAGAPDLSQATIGQLGNVDTTTTAPTSGQVLSFDGTNWVPTDAPTGSVDLTNYATLDSYQIFTAEKVFASDRTTVLGRLEGKHRNNPYNQGYTFDGMNTLNRFVLQSAYDGLVFSNQFINDLGFGDKSGRVTDVRISTTNNSRTALGADEIEKLFDAEASYVALSTPTTFDVDGNEAIIELDLATNLKWSATIGMAFESQNFSPRYGRIEVYNNNINAATGVAWGWQVLTEDAVKLGSQTNYLMSETHGDVSIGGAGISSIRFILKKDPSTGQTADIRIQSIFAVENNSKLGTSLYVDRSGGEIYGDLNVNGNFTVNGAPLAGGGATSITELSDVETSAAGHIPTDGQALVWNEAHGHWMPGTITGGATDLTNYYTKSETDALIPDISGLATTAYVDTAVAGAGGGSGASNLKRSVTVTANGNTGTLNIIANGSQADLDAVTVTANSTGSVVTIGNVAAGLMLTSVTFHQAPGFNTTAGWALEYPEVGGATTLATTTFPTGLHYNAGGAVQAANLWSVNNNAGTVTASKSGLVAGTEYFLSVKIV